MLAAIITIGIIFLDQITKILTDIFIEPGEHIRFIPYVLGLTHVQNDGAAFGILSNARWVFLIASTVAIIIIIYLLKAQKSRNLLFKISMGFLLGGGIGNMIDRIIRGYVVDFFEVLFFDFAVFNVADSFLTIGVVLLFIYIIFYSDKDGVQPEEKAIEEKEQSDKDESEDGNE